MKPLAPNGNIIYRSSNPQTDFCFSPAILIRPDGRYIVSLDISDEFGKILISDDKGENWHLVAERPFWHASLFSDGEKVYLLGACRSGNGSDLIVMRSDDNGSTWSETHYLTTDEFWCHCAADVWYKDEYVYLVMDKRIIRDGEVVRSGWKPSMMAPVVLRGKCGTDLLKRENWLFSEEARFRDVVDDSKLDDFGVPFFRSMEELGDDDIHGKTFWASPEAYRQNYDFEQDKSDLPFYFHAMGWLEGNIVQITDPKHYWYDPNGKTLHVFLRCNTHGTGYCAMMKAVERIRDGKEVIDVECEVTPSGKRIVFLPLPGGQNKFYIKYDEQTKLYWLASSQTVDSMTRMEFLSEDRYNLPSDERNRLVLHFSKNMVDWCFAGLVDKDENERRSRHYASMDIDGNDLIILSRSGDEETATAHDTNLITLHRIKDFRDLVY